MDVDLTSSGVYAASKAALTNASETLRLELAPFEIKVVTLMLGVVKSNIHANTAEYQMPEGSIYSPINQQIRDIDAGKDDLEAMDPEDFANAFVKELLRGKQGRLWMGKYAGTVKWASTLLPTRFFDALVSQNRGLDILWNLRKK